MTFWKCHTASVCPLCIHRYDILRNVIPNARRKPVWRARYDISVECHTDPLHPIWLSFHKSYLLYFIFFISDIHTHELTLLCSNLFQVFAIKLAGYYNSSVSHLLVTIFTPKTSRSAAEFLNFRNPFRRVWTELERFSPSLNEFAAISYYLDRVLSD